MSSIMFLQAMDYMKMSKETCDIKTKDGAEHLVKNARRAATHILTLLEKATGNVRRERMADMVLKWMLTTSPGYLSSDILEKVYLEIASRIHIPLPETFVSGTGLIVMTAAYIAGGHTKWVEQWVDCDRNRKYSLVLTEPLGSDLPTKLIKLISDRGGRIYCLGNYDRNANVKRLRQIASAFEVIVVSSHMHDVVPLLAFGTTDFQRPVVVMNHANHMFWPGISIADRLVDCGKWQQQMSLKYRGLDKTDNLPWLNSDADKKLDVDGLRKNAKQQLGIDTSRFVVITAAWPCKFTPIAGLDYTFVIEKVLKSCPKVEFYCIGVGAEDKPNWVQLSEKYGGRLHLCHVLPYEQFSEYCLAADLYVDSYPFTSGGSMYAAQQLGCPGITLCAEFDYPQWMRCDGEEELASRVIDLVLHPDEMAKFHARTMEYQISYLRMGERSYCEPLYEEFLTELCAMRHSVRVFKPIVPEISMNDYTILAIRYKREENERLKRNIELISIGPEWFGLHLVHEYNRLASIGLGFLRFCNSIWHKVVR